MDSYIILGYFIYFITIILVLTSIRYLKNKNKLTKTSIIISILFLILLVGDILIWVKTGYVEANTPITLFYSVFIGVGNIYIIVKAFKEWALG